MASLNLFSYNLIFSTYSSHRSFVSTDKGSIFIVNTKEKGEFHLIKKISEVHRNCDSRKLSHYDKTLYRYVNRYIS